MAKAITIEYLENKVGKAEAKELYSRIAIAGGFGDIGKEFAAGLPALDVTGLDDALLKDIEGMIKEAAAKPEEKKEGKK